MNFSSHRLTLECQWQPEYSSSPKFTQPEPELYYCCSSTSSSSEDLYIVTGYVRVTQA